MLSNDSLADGYPPGTLPRSRRRPLASPCDSSDARATEEDLVAVKARRRAAIPKAIATLVMLAGCAAATVVLPAGMYNIDYLQH